jgi:hypothetical protein
LAKGALGGARSFPAIRNRLRVMGVRVTRGDADVGGGEGEVYAEMVKPDTPDDAVRR